MTNLRNSSPTAESSRNMYHSDIRTSQAAVTGTQAGQWRTKFFRDSIYQQFCSWIILGFIETGINQWLNAYTLITQWFHNATYLQILPSSKISEFEYLQNWNHSIIENSWGLDWTCNKLSIRDIAWRWGQFFQEKANFHRTSF